MTVHILPLPDKTLRKDKAACVAWAKNITMQSDRQLMPSLKESLQNTNKASTQTLCRNLLDHPIVLKLIDAIKLCEKNKLHKRSLIVLRRGVCYFYISW